MESLISPAIEDEWKMIYDDWRTPKFKAGMQIEWQQILASSWWWSPECDCLSIQLQMNELAGFDACGRSHACCPCVCVCMCEVMGSEIVRNTGITGRSGAVSWDGCKTSPLPLKSHTQRWRGLSPEAPMLHLRCTDTHAHTHVFRCKCTCTLAHSKTDVCVQACTPIHTRTSAMQSALKLQTSYWAALQSAGLMKRYRVLQYSSVWGSGEQMAGVCNSSSLSSIM